MGGVWHGLVLRLDWADKRKIVARRGHPLGVDFGCELGTHHRRGLLFGLYLINKPRLDREAEEHRRISQKYERWAKGKYTIEELQDIEPEK